MIPVPSTLAEMAPGILGIIVAAIGYVVAKRAHSQAQRRHCDPAE